MTSLRLCGSKQLRGARIALPLASLASVVLLACGGEDELLETPVRPAIVTPVAIRDFEEQIEASGELLAKHRADVAAQIAGEITEIRADEGDEVEDGEVVIEIDPERRNLDLEAARARVGEAEAAVAETAREVKRMSALAGSRIAAESQLEQAETGLKTAQARLRAAVAELGTAERAVRDASVRARFPGHIGRRWVSRGEFVAAGQKLFELVSLDPIEVEFYLPEADTSRVSIGDPIHVSVAPWPDEIFEATVEVISPTIDPRTRTLRVKALIQNPDGRLNPGLFARALLGVAKRENVLMVPEEAVLQRADGQVVFKVLADNRVERRVVRTGAMREGWVEIRDGLAPGDSVVSRGHADLVDGAVIEPRNSDGSPAEPVASGGDEPGEDASAAVARNVRASQAGQAGEAL
jgi:membrane fusion protein (multidrug efflux system)